MMCPMYIYICIENARDRDIHYDAKKQKKLVIKIQQ